MVYYIGIDGLLYRDRWSTISLLGSVVYYIHSVKELRSSEELLISFFK